MSEKIAILLLDQVLDSAYAVVADILCTANRLVDKSKRVDIEMVSVQKKTIVSARGTRIPIDATIEEGRHYRAVVVPGIDFLEEVEECDDQIVDGFLDRNEVRKAQRWLIQQWEEGAVLSAGCTGTLLLAESGLLTNKIATTTWWLSPQFRERFPEITLCDDLTLTVSDRIVCGGAAMAHINLALYIVGYVYGPSLQELVSSRMIINESSRQTPFVDYSCMVHLPEIIRESEMWIKQRLDKTFGVEDLAKAVAVSSRTLARRFQQAIGKSPIQFIQHLRIQEAIRLLQGTEDSFESIAQKVGYQNSVGLRRVMMRETGRLPSHFRKVGG